MFTCECHRVLGRTLVPHTELLCFDVMPMGPLWWGQGDVPHGPHRAAVVTDTSQRALSSFLPWPSSSCLSTWQPPLTPPLHFFLLHSFLFLNSSTLKLLKGTFISTDHISRMKHMANFALLQTRAHPAAPQHPQLMKSPQPSL